MKTNDIAAATDQGMNWVDERNVSAPSRYAQDVIARVRRLLNAARTQGYDASLASTGAGGGGAPDLNVRDKAIPLGAIRDGEFQKHGLDPGYYPPADSRKVLHPPICQFRRRWLIRPLGIAYRGPRRTSTGRSSIQTASWMPCARLGIPPA